MTSVTVWGEAGGVGTLAAHHDRYGRMAEAHSYRDLSLELPAGGIKIDADHDGQRLGQLLYAELGEDERLRCVAVLDDDRLENVDEPVFFSPTLDMRGPGIDQADAYIASTARLLGLSLTLNTARVGAHPLSWRRGDLRSSGDRYGWPCSWQGSEPLLARALTHLGSDWQLRTRSAERIVDRRDDGSYPWHLVRASTWRPAGELHLRQPARADGRPAGKLHYGPLGRVLSVR